jgi:protein adenylyltransferase
MADRESASRLAAAEAEERAVNAPSAPSGLARLRFDNRFTRALPADPEPRNFVRQVHGAAFSRVPPTPVAAPRLIAYAPEVAALLELSAADCESERFVEVCSGNRLLDGMDPHACCYGGHQFGNWAGQLGDGRAIDLGEVVDAGGEYWTLQLKGAGLTPYSRTADGRAVLRSSLREYLCSEAMHHLGVPTTRALALIATGQHVVRDMFYDGHPREEPGAIVCRVAPTFTRFGNFEIFASRNDIANLRRLADHTIESHFPHLLVEAGLPANRSVGAGLPANRSVGAGLPANRYAAWFDEICRRTAAMIVHWMRVGFTHGVMNTDNMSVLGLTIDYGPYGWIDDYDPDWTPNTTDAERRRYRFGQQPPIAQWNLLKLANAIYPLIEDAKPLEEALSRFATHYEQLWRTMMAQKLGFARTESADDALLDALDLALRSTETDMTIFYRALADVDAASTAEQALATIGSAFYTPDAIERDARERIVSWLDAYLEKLRAEMADPAARRSRMNAVNPKYVLRNYLAQLAIDDAERGDYTLLAELHDVLRKPYDEQPDKARFFAKRPDWARQRAGCSMLSCSS